MKLEGPYNGSSRVAKRVLKDLFVRGSIEDFIRV